MTTPNQCQFWDCDEIIRRNYFLCADHYRGYDLGAIDQCPPCGKYKLAEYDRCRNCHRQAPPPSPRPSPGNACDEALLDKLHSLRRDLARRNKRQEFAVFSNATLAEMAAAIPTTEMALLSIGGVGPTKMELYGRDFLRVIQDHVGTNARPENRQPPPPSRQNDVQRDDREFPTDKGADRFFVYILLLNGGDYYIGQTREIDERMHEHRNNMSPSTSGREPKLQWFATVDTRSEAADLEADLQAWNSNRSDRRKITRLVADFKRLAAHLDYEPHQPAAENTIRERPVHFGGVRPPRRGQQSGDASRYSNELDVDDLPF